MTQPVRSKKTVVSTPAAPATVSAAAGFAVSARKTIAASRASIFAAWTDSRRRARWRANRERIKAMDRARYAARREREGRR